MFSLRILSLSASVIVVSCQLKVEVSSEDVIVPDTTLSPDPEATSTEFESSKLDFLRRRRRKMMTSTVSPALKILPKEPRITVRIKLFLYNATTVSFVDETFHGNLKTRV